jgi:hypothetical protein
MAPRQPCAHEHARFHSVQRLGRLPPIELWHCPTCNSTVAAASLDRTRRPVAAA